MNSAELFKVKKVFFIGIGGIGISALAQMFLSKGVNVSGVNDEDSPDTLNPLKVSGAEILFQKDLGNLPDADLYIFSDAWLYRGPEIIEEARKKGKTVLSYFQALGEIAKNYKVIAISGTHGKTTTTAMVTEILVDAGLDPTVVVGSFIKRFGSNFRAGKSEYLVIEADEYNRHMMEFHSYIGVVTNIEADHLDYYKNLEDVADAFRQFLAQSKHAVKDYQKYIDRVPKLSIPGEHNRQNAAAALAIADILKIDEPLAQNSLANFQGTWRRLDRRAETKNGTIIYDDYAHHPTEIKASIKALRELFPDKKITLVFQPHLYSRTKALFDDFAKSFGGVDRVILLPIYFAREAKDESVSSGKLAEAICQNNGKAIAFTDFKLASNYLKGETFGKNDLFVTMGAGEAYKIADQLFGLVLK